MKNAGPMFILVGPTFGVTWMKLVLTVAFGVVAQGL